MSNGGGWSPGKIFLVIVCVVVGLGILCCGGVFLIWNKEIRATYDVTMDSVAFVQRLQAQYGPSTAFQMLPDGDKQFIIAIGVEGELTPERVAEVQDGVWKILSEVYGKNGFVPVRHVAIGHPSGSPGSQAVQDWPKNMVSAEDLVKRTGIQPPPVMKLIPTSKGGGRIRIPAENDETTEEKSGDGSGGK